jgi:hypothetical protein
MMPLAIDNPKIVEVDGRQVIDNTSYLTAHADDCQYEAY